MIRAIKETNYFLHTCAGNSKFKNNATYHITLEGNSTLFAKVWSSYDNEVVSYFGASMFFAGKHSNFRGRLGSENYAIGKKR